MSLEDIRQEIIQQYRTTSGEAESNQSSFSEESSDIYGEPSASRQLAAGFSQGHGLVSNILRTMEARSPKTAEAIYSVIPGLTDKGDLDEYYGVDFDNPYLTPQDRRNIMAYQKARDYEYIYGDVEQSGFWYELGKLGAEIADPSIALPAGGIGRAGALTAAAIWGGLYAGADSAARSSAEQGAIDVANMFISVGAGAALGAGMQGLMIGPLQNYFRSKAASGSKVTPDELKDQVRLVTKDTEYDLNVDNINFNAMADELNFSFFNKTPEEQYASFTFERDTGSNMWTAWDTAVTDYKAGKFDQFRELGTDAPVPPVSPFKASLAKDMADYKKIQREARKGNQSAQDAFLLKKYREANPQPKNPAMREAFIRAMDDQRAESVDRIALARQVQEDIYEEILRTDIPMDTVGAKIIQDASILKSASGNPKYNPDARDFGTLNEIVSSMDVPYTSHTGSMLSPPVDSPVPFSKNFDNLPEAVKIKTAGAMVTHFLGARSIVGVRPKKLWQAYGPAGKMMDDALTIAEANKRQAMAGYLTRLRKTMSESGVKSKSVEAQLALDVARKTVNVEDVSPEIARVGNEIRNQYREILEQLHRNKIIDDKQYDALKTRSRKYGYVSRVFDDNYLKTREGREAFADALAKVEFGSEEAIMNSLASLLGEKSRKLKIFKDQIKISDSGKRTLSREAWLKINNLRKMAEPSRSKYVDNDRKIPEEFEQALRPFLVNDPEQVMFSYLDDVLTRLEYAKVFGPNDELAHALIKKIDDVADDPVVGRTLQNVYWDSVRDPRSDNIQQFVNMSQTAKTVGTSLRAFEILRLAFAQILNLGQPITTGTLKLTASDALSPVEAYAVSMKGLVNGFRAKFGNQELREVAERSGAANQAMIANYIGHLNETYNKIIPGRDLPGGSFNPLNTINNPQEFLRVTGFFHTDHLAKLQGFYQGKAYIEHLMSKKSNLLAKGSRANPKEMEKVNKALEELGIERHLTPDQVPVNIVERGAAMFSDAINFTPSANEVPLFYNSFFGKISRQFSSFAFRASGFIIDNIINPLKKGNVVPLITYMGVLAPGVGMPIDAFRRMLTADDREFTNTEKYLRGYGTILGFGVTMDILDRAAQNPMGLVAVAAGPAGQDVSKIGYGVSKAVTEQSMDPLLQQIKSVIPQGRRLFPEIQKEKETFENHFKNTFKDM